MARLPHEITFTVERRQAAVMQDDGTEKLGFFHKWTKCGNDDFALVENAEGIIEYIPPHALRFLPIGDEIAPKQLEKMYKELGLIKSGGSGFVRKTEIEPSNKNRCPICLTDIPDGRRLCTECEKKGWKQL